MHIVVSSPAPTKPAANTSPSTFSAIPSLGGRSLGKGVNPARQPEEVPLGDGRSLVLEDS